MCGILTKSCIIHLRENCMTSRISIMLVAAIAIQASLKVLLNLHRH